MPKGRDSVQLAVTTCNSPTPCRALGVVVGLSKAQGLTGREGVHRQRLADPVYASHAPVYAHRTTVGYQQGQTTMASFDIVSRTDLQEVDNAVQGALREIGTRYDFKGSSSRSSGRTAR